jgi:glycine C-acetyltransferase
MVNHLYDAGVYAHGLCYPVVPEGEARIRLLVSSLHSSEQLQQTLHAMASAREAAAFHLAARDALKEVGR